MFLSRRFAVFTHNFHRYKFLFCSPLSERESSGKSKFLCRPLRAKVYLQRQSVQYLILIAFPLSEGGKTFCFRFNLTLRKYFFERQFLNGGRLNFVLIFSRFLNSRLRLIWSYGAALCLNLYVISGLYDKTDKGFTRHIHAWSLILDRLPNISLDRSSV